MDSRGPRTPKGPPSLDALGVLSPHTSPPFFHGRPSKSMYGFSYGLCCAQLDLKGLEAATLPECVCSCVQPYQTWGRDRGVVRAAWAR